MDIKFCCSKCGDAFDSKEDCLRHEEKHPNEMTVCKADYKNIVEPVAYSDKVAVGHYLPLTIWVKPDKCNARDNHVIGVYRIADVKTN